MQNFLIQYDVTEIVTRQVSVTADTFEDAVAIIQGDEYDEDDSEFVECLKRTQANFVNQED